MQKPFFDISEKKQKDEMKSIYRAYKSIYSPNPVLGGHL